jgi:hypothetical protein
VLRAVNDANVPYFPARLKLGLTVHIKARHPPDVWWAYETIIRVLRYRCWWRPKIVGIRIKVREVSSAAAEMTEVMISRMDM